MHRQPRLDAGHAVFTAEFRRSRIAIPYAKQSGLRRNGSSALVQLRQDLANPLEGRVANRRAQPHQQVRECRRGGQRNLGRRPTIRSTHIPVARMHPDAALAE
jgi:hypothetical protein